MTTTTTSVDFREVDLKLRAYLAATCADLGKLVRRAVTEHIDAELDANPGVRARFDKAMAGFVSDAGGNVATIVPKRRSGRVKAQENAPPAASKP